MLDITTMRRLALVRYMYTLGIEQSHQPEPICSTSILLFHDSAELFLQLACDRLNASKSDIKFMDYWELINSKLDNSELPQKESMRRLNSSRGNFKHHGTMPSVTDIEGFRANVGYFFRESTPIIFGIEFDSISLIDVVQNANVKKRLVKASEHLEVGLHEEALDQIAIAYSILVFEHEIEFERQFGRKPYQIEKRTHRYDESRIGEFHDMNGSINGLQNAVKTLSLGIDIRKFTIFNALTPPVSILYSREHVISASNSRKHTSTKEEVQFCLSFVIESALIIQQIKIPSFTKD